LEEFPGFLNLEKKGKNSEEGGRGVVDELEVEVVDTGNRKNIRKGRDRLGLQEKEEVALNEREDYLDETLREIDDDDDEEGN
jgi:hypothetical protein